MRKKTKEAAALFGSKFFFLIAGYTLYIVLSRLLSTEEFGLYGIVIGVLTLLNMILTIGSMQTISHFVAAQSGSENDVRRRGFAYQSFIAFPIAIGFFMAARPLAEFFQEPELAGLFRIAAIIPFMHAYATINIGYFNGLRQFGRQAAVDIAYQILRVTFIVGLVYYGFGLRGVIAGFIVAVSGLLIISFKLVTPQGDGRAKDYKPEVFFKFALPVMAVAFLFNALLQTDLFLLKRLSDPAEGGHLTGLYTAAQSIARIPFFIMIAASVIVFPVLAKLKEDTEINARQRARWSGYALTGSTAVLAGMAASTIPLSEKIILIFYPPQYAPAAAAMAILIAGMCLMTLLHICTSMISGAGRPGGSAALLTAALGIQLLCVFVLIPRYELTGAAIGTGLSAFITLIACVAWMKKRLGTQLPLRRAGAIAAVTAVTFISSWAFDRFWPHPGMIAIVAFLAGIFSLHCGLLAGMGLFGRNGKSFPDPEGEL